MPCSFLNIMAGKNICETNMRPRKETFFTRNAHSWPFQMQKVPLNCLEKEPHFLIHTNIYVYLINIFILWFKTHYFICIKLRGLQVKRYKNIIGILKLLALKMSKKLIMVLTPLFATERYCYVVKGTALKWNL